MIFVTTGSTKQSVFYLPLLKRLEILKKEGLIDDEIIVQTGYIKYKSDTFKEMFDFTMDFDKYIDKADIVITADGAGTIFDLLTKQKKTIVVSNELASRYGAPAGDFIGGFEEDGYLFWCKSIDAVVEDIDNAKNRTFNKYRSPGQNISKTIISKFDEWKNKRL